MWNGKFIRVGELQVGDNFLTKSNHVLSVVAFKMGEDSTVILTTRNHMTQKQRDGHWHIKAAVFKVEPQETGRTDWGGPIPK